ncbi:MAG: hypothetical protein B6U88_02745 [Candidatus Aenigmarchaeota archaeon ex4484_56]|nr:MAG: hypothetical protein B6U88_02745 [Candidatus Aenigmarchaeota archaeon ex4484_56]
MIYSYSRLSCFEKCPLKFKFKYIDNIEITRETVEAFLGNIVHKTLERLYRDLKFQKQNSLEELLTYYNSQWIKNWSNSVLIVRKEYSEENFRKMGEQYITDYYNTYYPFNEGKIVALEKKITFNLDEEGKYKLQGYIDRLMFNKGVYEIHDYKTNFDLPFDEILKQDKQLPLYAVAVINKYPDVKKVRLIWHFLSVNKEVVIEKKKDELEKIKKETLALIKKIESIKEFKPKKSKLCDWCEFKEFCPEWKHIVKTEKLEVNKFLNEPGVKLANKYIELKTKKEEFLEKIDEELKQVKEAIIRFCNKEGITTLNGSGYELRVWNKEVIKFPNKQENGREEVEKIIKDNNLWMEFSELNSFKLSKYFEEGKLSKKIMKKLDKFKGIDVINKIYLKKKAI